MPDDLEEAREVKAELRRALERVEALRTRLLEKPVEREGPTTRLGGADADSEDRRRELVFREVRVTPQIVAELGREQTAVIAVALEWNLHHLLGVELPVGPRLNLPRKSRAHSPTRSTTPCSSTSKQLVWTRLSAA